MKPASASQIKGTKRRGPPPRSLPREGTRLRALYDLFMANKGAVINRPLTIEFDLGGIAIEQLRNFYGLDIRCVGYGQWLLAGEWFGRVYIDYVAERHEVAE